MNQEPMRMRDWMTQLDRLIRTFDGKLLNNAGAISHDQALKKAQVEYKKYQTKTASAAEKEYLESIKTVEKQVKKSSKTTKPQHKKAA